MAPTRRGSGWRGAVGMAIVLLAMVAARRPRSLPGQAALRPHRRRRPRQGTWTRSFNPFRSDAESRWPTWAGIYEPLLISNRATGAFTPWLASAYSWSADNLTFRITTRAGVRWSDGQPFSARDVAFTFDLMRRHPALDHDAVWLFLESVTAKDAQTVEFKLKRPYTPGAVYLGEQVIVPEHKWKDVAQPATFDDPSPVATGPFVTVLKFEPTVYELGRNPTYWQPGKPGVDVLRVPLYRSNAEIVKALVANQVDWASLFFPDIEKEWVAADPAHHQYWYPDAGPTVLLYLDTHRKPFDDKSVRKALSMALDRPRFTKEALNGYAPPADATGLADSQKKWKDAALAQDRVDEAQRRGGQQAARRRRAGPGRGRHPRRGHGADALHLPDRAGLDGLAGGGGDHAPEPGRGGGGGDGEDARIQCVGRRAQARAFRDEHGLRQPRAHALRVLPRPDGRRARAPDRREGGLELPSLRGPGGGEDPAPLRGDVRRHGDGALAIELQKRFVQDAPSIPLFIGPQWGVYNTTRLTGFPSRFRPYASAVPTGSPRGAFPAPDSLPVLLEVKPR